jgi:hypothetical protein
MPEWRTKLEAPKHADYLACFLEPPSAGHIVTILVFDDAIAVRVRGGHAPDAARGAQGGPLPALALDAPALGWRRWSVALLVAAASVG